jgi:hypothetical protein
MENLTLKLMWNSEIPKRGKKKSFGKKYTTGKLIFTNFKVTVTIKSQSNCGIRIAI